MGNGAWLTCGEIWVWGEWCGVLLFEKENCEHDKIQVVTGCVYMHNIYSFRMNSFWTEFHTQLFTWTDIFHLYSEWLLIQNENAHVNTSVYSIPFHSGVPNRVAFGIKCLYGKCIPIQSVYTTPPNQNENSFGSDRNGIFYSNWGVYMSISILNEHSFRIQVEYTCACKRT